MLTVSERDVSATKTLVLCEPPYVFWDRSMDRLRQGEETIPGMGVLILAAVARQRGYRVHLIDAKEQGTPLDEVSRQIVALRPDYLGLSATTISVTNAARIADRVKQLAPGVTTILGGSHVSAIPERTLDAFPSIDFGVVGEGEVSLFELLARLESGRAIDDVPGLAYRRDGQVHSNLRAPYIDDLDALPMPAWDLLPDFPHRFQPSLFSYPRTPVATLITSRGCPFSCSFCDRSTSGKRGRMHGVEYVIGLCRHLVGLGVRHIIFVDDLFTVRKQRVVELCQALLDHRLDLTWSCNSHPNLLDLDTLKLMRRAGCWQIAYGIESGSQRVLDMVKREVSIPKMRETLRMTQAAGIRSKGYLMIGHPTEGLDSLAEDVAFLKEVELDLCQITKFTPYPGTPAYPTIRDHGTFDEDWERMNAMNFMFVPRGLSEDVLETYFDHLYSTFYSRPDVLWGLARLLMQEPRYIKRLAASAVVYLRSKFAAGRYLVGRLPQRYRVALDAPTQQ
ncbi:MAG: cobalamin B12-binding domain-containing protein [Deltaproteobacteria bacterium]|nr:cobalamin B12-binding domain-containing protein [Deltaproteobacteria bacterium]MBI3386612.1 cobalamin B12-binding domain-containing protein [Deltaproteobacteria bacterium]